MTNGSDTPQPLPEPSPRSHPVSECLITLLSTSDQAPPIVEAFLDALSDAISVIDASGRILFSNGAWKQFRDDWSQEANDGSYFTLLSHLLPDEIDRLKAGIQGVFQKECPLFQYEFGLQREGAKCRYQVLASRISLPLPAAGGEELPGLVSLSHKNITEYYKIERDLRESHALFRRATESIRDGVFLYDREGRIVMVNSVYAEMLGFTVAEMLGKSVYELFSPELAHTIYEQNLLVLTMNQTLSFEQVLSTIRRRCRLHVCKGVYRNHRNEVVGVFGVVRDISDKRGAEESLEKSEHHFRALIENSADRVCLLAADGKIRYASPSSKRILGIDIDELLNADAFQYVHPECSRGLAKCFKELRQRPGASLTHRYRSLHKNGSWRWMEATLTNLLNDPSVRSIVVNERDITPRKEAEDDLLRFANIVQSSHDAIISTDEEGLITSWNPAAERIFGYKEKEILGQKIYLLMGEEWLDKHRRLRSAALRGKGAQGLEAVLLAKEDRPIDVAMTISPIFDRDRRVVGVAKIIQDISDRRSLEREILETSDREKERIGQDLHDDLCQHLIGISLLGDRLTRELEKKPEQLEHAGKVREITTFIRTAVDHSRRLARGLSLVDLNENGLQASLEQLVENTEQLFRVPCFFESEANISVANPDVAKGLFRIAQEALHNAVKHSQASRIDISLKSGREAIVITVSDDGVGMAETRARVKEGPESGGFGLHGMDYRARSIGAVLEFRKNRSAGTSVICRIQKGKCS